MEVNRTDVAHTCMTIRSNHVTFNNKLKLPFKLQPNKKKFILRVKNTSSKKVRPLIKMTFLFIIGNLSTATCKFVLSRLDKVSDL